MSYIKYIRRNLGNDWVILNACAVVITNEKNEILLQKRTDNLMWGLPGGLMELDDSIESCALREVKEETNVDVELKKFIGVFNNPFMRWRDTDYARIISFAFYGKVIGSKIKINYHESLESKDFDYSNLPLIHSMDTLQIIEAFYHKKFQRIEGKEYNG